MPKSNYASFLSKFHIVKQENDVKVITESAVFGADFADFALFAFGFGFRFAVRFCGFGSCRPIDVSTFLTAGKTRRVPVALKIAATFYNFFDIYVKVTF